MDFKKEIHSLFDGIYHPEKDCFFCGKRCENDCAIKCIESAFDYNKEGLFIWLDSRYLWIRGIQIFTESIIPKHSANMNQNNYMIYAFVNYLVSYSELLYHILEHPNLSTSTIKMAKEMIKSYNENLTKPSFILKDTLFLENVEYVLYFLENGGEIKHPE
jgi:hypothetical protein